MARRGAAAGLLRYERRRAADWGSETQGIARIGDTVWRPLRPFSLTAQAYLAHLRDAGFTGAPLTRGVDEQGREVLSFVPGEVARWPLPREMAGDGVLVALAQLVRALHEASAGWRTAL
jgi:hypothetical protein